MTDTNFTIPADRRIAKQLGLLIYKAITSCRRKHKSFRYVKNGDCVECAQIRGKAANKKIAERVLQKQIEAKRQKKFAHSEWLRQKGKHIRRERLRQATPKWSDARKSKSFTKIAPKECTLTTSFRLRESM